MTDQLRRGLSRRQMVLLGLGSALGTGLFLGLGSAIAVAGPAVLISFAIGAVIAAIVGFALAEMATVHPDQGAFGAVASRYLSPAVGFGQRWTYWFALMGGIGSEVVAAALYVQYWWPDIPLWVLVVVLAIMLALVNIRTVGLFGRIESVFAGIKVLAVLVFIAIGILLIVFPTPRTPTAGLSNFTAHGGFFPHGGVVIWAVMATVIFSFTGVELISISAAEALDPKRSVRSAIRSMVVRLAVFYLGAIAVILAVLPWPVVAHSHGVQQSPFVTMFGAVGITAAASVTNALVLIAALSAANANLYAAARMVHSLAGDGFAPARLARLNNNGAPAAAVLVSMIGLVVAAVLAVYAPSEVFMVLISLASFGVIAVWTTILITFVAFRRAGSARAASVRLPGGPVSAVVGVCALLSIYATGFVSSDMALACAVGVPFMVLLAVSYLLLRMRQRKATAQAG